MWTFENKEYQSMLTSHYIPYTLYIHEDHLLLVPRELVHQKHPKFPTIPDQNKRYTLHLSDHWFRVYTENYGKPPKFTYMHAAFGLEENLGVVVAALLPGINMIPCWDFNSILASTETEIKEHFSIESSTSLDDFESMKLDLSSTA